jgi:hypothetical protein
MIGARSRYLAFLCADTNRRNHGDRGAALGFVASM